jgi:hypothetical protein
MGNTQIILNFPILAPIFQNLLFFGGKPLKPTVYAIIPSLLLNLFFSISVFADVSINDPGDLLLKADAFLGTLDFNNSFKVGDKAVYTNSTNSCQYSCDQGTCFSICDLKEWESQRQVYTCNEAQVTMGTDDGAFYIELSKDLFTSLKGNFARYIIAHLDEQIKLPGHAEVFKFTEGPYKIDDKSGGTRSIDSFSVWGDYVLDNGLGHFSFVVSLAKDVPVVAQIIRLRIENQTWYRLKSL